MRRWVSAAATAALVVQAMGLSLVTASSATAEPSGDLTTLTADPLDTWQTNGIAWTVEAANGVVYVGGTFTSVRPPGAAAGTGEQPRNNLAAFDAVTGDLLPCDPNITLSGSGGTVRALKASPDGSRLYIGGSFSRVGTTGVANFVSLSTATCGLTSLAQFRRPAVSATVRAIAATSTTAYVGGDFGTVDGQPRARFAAFDAAGSLTAATATFNLPVRAIVAAPEVGKIIVGGDFTSVNGSTATSKLVSLDPQTGAVVQTYPGWVPTNSVVKVLVRDAENFYVGAEGTGGGVFDGRIAALLSTGEMKWKDLCLGATQALAPYNGVLYSGSHAHDCSKTPGGFPEGKRHHMLAQSIDDKTILPWFPNTNGGLGEALGPRQMVMAGNQLWVVGEFTVVNDSPQQGITRFVPEPDTGYVSAPVLSGSSKSAGKVLVSWTAGWDRDDDKVTYELFRTGTNEPINTVTVSSREWDRPRLSFMDTVAPGSTVSYRMRTSDGTNISPKGALMTVTAATTSADSYNAAVFEDSPQLNWKLDETSGSIAADDTGAGRTGTYANASLNQPSALQNGAGRSVNFNGSSSRVSTTATNAVPGPQAYSVEAWFRTSSQRGGKIVGYGSSRTGSSGSYDRQIYLNNAGNVFYGNYTGSAQVLKSARSYRDGAWHHVVGTTGPEGMRLYVDGVQVGANAVNRAESYSGYWKVGGDNLGGWPERPSSDFFAGGIDEVAVYPRALTAARVFEHFRQGRPSSVNDVAVPSAPTALTASAQSSRVALAWNASSDDMLVAGYQLHRSTVAGFTPTDATQVALVERTSTVDVAPSGTWFYKVVAVDGVGKKSAPSNEVSMLVADTQAPTTPTRLEAAVFGDQVDLTWSASTDDTEVTSYQVHRLPDADTSPSAASLVGTSPTPDFSATAVPAGTWYYRVVAVDAAGNASGASAAERAVTADVSSDIDFDAVDTLAPTPTFTTTGGAASTLPGATLVAPTDARLTYRGAAGFRFGSSFPDTLLYQPTSRYPNSWGNPSAYSVSFRTDAAAFEVYTKYYNAAQAIQVKVNGQRTTAVPRSVNGTTLGSRMVYKVDLGSSAVRDITLEVSMTPFGGIYVPAGATLTKAPAATSRWMVVGDSITAGSSQNAAGSAGSWMLKTADYLGWDDAWNQAIGGTGYVSDNLGSSRTIPERVAGDVVPYAPQRVVIWAGVNDQMESQTSIAAAAADTYAAIRSGTPGTRTYVVGPWSQSGTPTNALQSTDETLRQAARAAGLPFVSPITGRLYGADGVLLVAQRPWITGTGNTSAPAGDGNADAYVGTDGVHPTDAGHAYIARRMALALEQLTKNEPAFDTQAPTAPASVTGTVSGSTVALEWDAASDDVAVSGYDVFRGSAAGFAPGDANRVATVTSTLVGEDDVPAGTWFYKVIAKDAGGNRSTAGTSPAIQVLAPDTQAPTAPSGVTTAVSGADVTVDWTASTDDRGVAGYQVHRGGSASFAPSAATKVADVTSTSATETGVLGGTWYYKVVAVDAADNASQASAAAQAVVVSGPAVEVTQQASADTYVNAGVRTASYGTSTSMIVDGSPDQQSLLRFDLPTPPSGQQLTSAVLRVRTTNQTFATSSDPMQVRVASDEWDEATVTYNTRPALTSTVLGTFTAPDLLTTYDVPLDAAALRSLTGAPVTFALTMAGGDNTQFFTRDAGSGRPVLELRYS